MESIYFNVIQQLKKGKTCLVSTELKQEKGQSYQILKKEMASLENKKETGWMDGLQNLQRGIWLQTVDSANIKIMESFWPEERLIILGGGHISLFLSEFAAKVGFSVIVVDDRPYFANNTRFPEAKSVICSSFSQAVKELEITQYDYVVMVTRGHRHDMECYKLVLDGIQPFYTGMIGSKRRIRGMKEQLLKEGYSTEILEQLHAPIGLSIGAQTPEEIAVSIVGQLICKKRMNQTQPAEGKGNIAFPYTTDYRVLEAINQLKEAIALVTVLETKGSVPRKAGAKMVVRKSGQVIGTIGGGCSEMEVIREAVPLIDKDGARIMEIDMTGDVAEEEGMVCGGIMTVLIETFLS